METYNSNNKLISVKRGAYLSRAPCYMAGLKQHRKDKKGRHYNGKVIYSTLNRQKRKDKKGANRIFPEYRMEKYLITRKQKLQDICSLYML